MEWPGSTLSLSFLFRWLPSAILSHAPRAGPTAAGQRLQAKIQSTLNPMIDTNDHQSPITVISLSGPPLPVDLEFKRQRATHAFESHGLPMGRCFGSKSLYQNTHPKCEFVPNANVFSRLGGKVWWGDLDLERDRRALERVARRLRCRLYVVSEHDGRFDEAVRPHTAVIRDAVWQTGGPARIPGIGRFFRESGLSLGEAAVLLKVSPRRLSGPQEPKTALEVGRRLGKLVDNFRPIGLKAGYGKWGHWWTKPNKKLGGKSPLQILKSGEGLELGKIAPMTFGLFFFSVGFGAMRRL